MTSPTPEIDIALEVLSVTIGGIMEDVSVEAVMLPKADDGYAGLSLRLKAAGDEISTLAAAMTVLARRRDVEGLRAEGGPA